MQRVDHGPAFVPPEYFHLWRTLALSDAQDKASTLRERVSPGEHIGQNLDTPLTIAACRKLRFDTGLLVSESSNRRTVTNLHSRHSHRGPRSHGIATLGTRPAHASVVHCAGQAYALTRRRFSVDALLKCAIIGYNRGRKDALPSLGEDATRMGTRFCRGRVPAAVAADDQWRPVALSPCSGRTTPQYFAADTWAFGHAGILPRTGGMLRKGGSSPGWYKPYVLSDD